MLRKQISLVVIGLSIGCLLFASYRFGIVYAHSKGLDAHDRGDYVTARNVWRVSAELGYTLSKAMVGSLYLTGKGGTTDPELANRYLLGAAEDGLVDAQAIYGIALYSGGLLPKDKERGLYWLNKAAAQGDLEALKFLSDFDQRSPTPK
jgi:TPR repeat protein